MNQMNWSVEAQVKFAVKLYQVEIFVYLLIQVMNWIIYLQDKAKAQNFYLNKPATSFVVFWICVMACPHRCILFFYHNIYVYLNRLPTFTFLCSILHSLFALCLYCVVFWIVRNKLKLEHWRRIENYSACRGFCGIASPLQKRASLRLNSARSLNQSDCWILKKKRKARGVEETPRACVILFYRLSQWMMFSFFLSENERELGLRSLSTRSQNLAYIEQCL